MKNKWVWWECSSCGTIFFGKMTKDGFINEEELRKPRAFQAEGCAFCGYSIGEILSWDDVVYVECLDL